MLHLILNSLGIFFKISSRLGPSWDQLFFSSPLLPVARFQLSQHSETEN